MNKIKTITFIVGTRPQIIKSQPLIHELIKKKFNVKIIHTGQHYDSNLSQIFFKDLQISTPSKNLKIKSDTQLKQISKIISLLEKHLNKSKPDLVIIPGDTTSAIAGALCASKLGIRLAHLEAGARSNQFYMTEEINRRLIDHCSDILFAPTKNCLKNLKDESVYGKSFFVGDTMLDLFKDWKKQANFKNKKTISQKILVTIHRTETIKDLKNLKKISLVINRLSKEFKIFFPMHPHTKKILKQKKIKLYAKILPPLNHSELMNMIHDVDLVITDSGGLQKEAFWMNTPCITLREHTEWTETVDEGANVLAPLSKPFPFSKISKLINKKIKAKRNLFGNGNASKKISIILKNLN